MQRRKEPANGEFENGQRRMDDEFKTIWILLFLLFEWIYIYTLVDWAVFLRENVTISKL